MTSPEYIESYSGEAIALLKKLIATPSFSGEESQTATLIEEFLMDLGIPSKRIHNNVLATNQHFDVEKPTLLLNSHHDTVKPNSGYSQDPYDPCIKNEKLFGLGSNDAGGCLVSLIQVFAHFYTRELPYNLMLAATAEEENSGPNGITSILTEMTQVDFGIVGEPTEMKAAVAEKGLLVLDCYAKGKAGHAARNEGINAIYEALHAIEWIRNYRFPKVSQYLGEVKMTVTMINAGTQHNVVPDQCHFVVDVRTTDVYSNEEILETIKDHLKCEVVPRSTRLNSSATPPDHAFLKSCQSLRIEQYGSPTLSDQALLPFPTVKIGPGKSERSHTADEYIKLSEIAEGIARYITLLEHFFNQKQTR